MRIDEREIRRLVDRAVGNQKAITFVTYMLSSYGDTLLKTALSSILERYGREDLFDIAYAASRELIINATKANLKRVLFQQMNLDMNDELDYETGMDYFRRSLSDDKIKSYRNRFRENNLPVTTTIYYNMNVLNIKVKNNFTLEPVEEQRLRGQFAGATGFSSLFDFFMEYGENANDASMGITMVGILLDRSGIDRHAFTLYSSEKYHETIAKLEIPLVDYYVPKRKMFEMELDETRVKPEELRPNFHYTYRDFKADDL
jgi:hypothetical protein